jgi:hypothetical protein
MDLESVRSLKQECFAEMLSRRIATRSSLPREALVVGSPLPRAAPVPPIALGISGREGDYRLAVRIQALTPGLQRNLDRILNRAHGEATIRVVGPLFKQNLKSRRRPLSIGSSVGHFRSTAGTLGCFVTLGGSERHILSNNHVLADENRAALGDEILQPAPADSGVSPLDRIATLSGFEPLANGGNNLVDAAVAAILDGLPEDRQTLSDLGSLNGLRTSPIEEGELIFKVGRTTGLTRGRVSAFEVDEVWVGYDMGEIGFDQQIEIEPSDDSPFSLDGDSGALIVDEELRAVGLLFAGNDVDVTYANPIQTVLQTLGAQLL